MYFITYIVLSKLVGNRGNAHWCNFPLEYLLSAPRLMRKYISFPTVLLSRLKTAVRRGSGACIGNRKGNRSNVSSQFGRRYTGTFPSFITPVFVHPRRGWPFLSLSSDISLWLREREQERRSPLKRWNPFGRARSRNKEGAKGDSYPHCRIAIFRPLPLYFTPLIPTP